MKQIIILLVVVSVLFSGCGVLTPTEDKPDVAIAPIVLDVIVSKTGSSFDRDIESHINPELLEKHFGFFGLFDASNEVYQFVKDDVLTSFRLNSSAQTLEASGQPSIGYQRDQDELTLDVQAFASLLGLQLKQNAQLRILSDGVATLERAQLTGTAFRDYTRQQAVEFKDKDVAVVNRADGFALIVIDDHPFITSDDNLTAKAEQSSSPTATESVVPRDKPLVIAWDLYGNKSDQAVDALIDVVIPKWLSLQDSKGNINDLFRPEYTANVKRQGAGLWVLINNQFDPDMTASFLADSKARKAFIAQVMAYTRTHPVQGINVDFENMYQVDSDKYVQLIAELYVEMKAAGLPLSVAVTVPEGSPNWSLVYDRPRLAAVSDYILLMAYDQHWENAPKSGPVAGLSWVDANIQKMLKLVPAEKLVLGLPFYTRIWYESLSPDKPNAMRVRSKSVFMDAPRTLIDANQPVRVWDAEHSQYYFAYFEGDRIVKFWYDDAAAVARKAELFKKYNLAGIACWSLGFENAATWQQLKEVIERD